MFELLQKLAAVSAPTGNEYPLSELIAELIRPYVDNVTIDELGDVIGFVGSEAGASDAAGGKCERRKNILYSAHMDEVGFIAAKIEGNGYIRFNNLGGPNLVSAAYREVVFPASGIHGMIVPHTGSDGNLQLGTMVVDIGASDKAEAEKYVSVGDSFTLVPGIIHEAGSKIAGHPVDDRIGCAILIDAARKLKESGKRPYNNVYFGFSVQEEVTAAGARVMSNIVQPDIGIAVDVCGTGDTIGAFPMQTVLGGGAAILLSDTRLIGDRRLAEDMKTVCRENDITYQIEVCIHGGTDAVPMVATGGGCRAGVISIPMRYLHTSAETADMFDAEQCRDLVCALCFREF